MDFNELEKYISADRLFTYSTLLGVSVTDLDKAVGAYHWNKALGGAVYSFLQCLEVSLRNSVHMAAKAKFGKENWYEPVCRQVRLNIRKKQKKAAAKALAAGLTPKPIVKFTATESKIWKAINQLKRERKIVSSANIISTLMFGFWADLFQDDYMSGDRSLLWPELLPIVFPNAPKGMPLKTYCDELLDINFLRNRFSHHEPLWKSGSVSSVNDAITFSDDEMSKIMRYVHYISADRAKMLKSSVAYKEFKALNKAATLDVFIGAKKNILSTHQFKADLNLHLKNVCDNHQMVFVKRNTSIVKVVSY